MEQKIFETYCTGCGLCTSYSGKELVRKSDGFDIVDLSNDPELLEFCKKTCPANGRHLLKQGVSAWGKFIRVYEGHAADRNIRYASASGGVTTAVAVYLLEKGYIDGVIQVGKNEKNPFSTAAYCSRTSEEIRRNCASRYVSSSPLERIVSLLKTGETYAFIGRPCDIVTLNNFLNWNPEYRKQIFCTLTFFCAGAPSPLASEEMARHLGADVDKVKTISYRGNGWPGKVCIEENDGKLHTMEYIDSWNTILGRNIRKICKFCSDGVGEAADISSGDLWYLDKHMRPVFEEKDGRNVIFARSDLGDRILKEAQKEGYLCLNHYENKLSELDAVQPNHAIRKRMLFPRILAMKTLRRVTPKYDMSKLMQYSHGTGIGRITKSYLGTIKRILSGRL